MKMKKSILLSAFGLISFCAVFVFKNKIIRTGENIFYSLERRFEAADAEDKEVLEPNDAFWQQRTVPGELPDEAAYHAAMQEAQMQMQSANRGVLAFQGFDKLWTTEGPANIGARVNSLAIHPTNENIMYAGFERGGVWKTTNGGTSWLPIFDAESTLSGGDICLDPSNPNNVYVGTGDPSIPFTTFSGNGVYKSLNAGSTWANIGLTAMGVISRVAVSPNNSNTIYAAAMGKPFLRDNNRGLYKTTNGGTTWTQVLFINNETGITDMVINPTNPQEIYVAAMTCIRSYTENKRASVETKILKTTNGGTTWTVVQGGLPVGEEHNRIGLTMCKSQPNVLYAVYTDPSFAYEGIYKTTDSGANWTVVGDANSGIDVNMYNGFGWYFGQIRVNPTNPDEVTVLSVEMWSSQDGGLSWFKSVPPWYTYEVHADKHAMVYTNTGKIIIGTDGGIYRSDVLTDNTNGNTWTDIENIPCTQFYHVAHNPHNSTTYHGGAQDNGSTTGNAANLTAWTRDYGGDGFQSRFHKTDPNIIYYETQNGGIVGTIDGGASTFGVRGSEAATERTNWNTPYILSPHNQNTLYYGCQSLYKSTDNGQTSVKISDTLTGNITWLKSAHTITSIDESPVTVGKLYVGTGNGYLWRSLNGGTSWDSIHQNGLPRRYLTSVVASPSNSNRVFATFSGYKLNDNTPHVFRSDNNGTTWTSIRGNLPNFVINDIFVMPNRNDQILFVATDVGVFGSLNAGTTWERLGTNMPLIPINDIEYNPTLNTLIAGSFARGILSYPMAVLLPTSGAAAEQLHISIFPNPTTDVLNFSIKNQDLSTATYRIFDLNGKEIVQKTALSNPNIDVADLPKGVYILSVQFKNGQKVAEKWVKM
jgi:photosystem II stability/assembly factor-like uncharacterized protein